MAVDRAAGQAFELIGKCAYSLRPGSEPNWAAIAEEWSQQLYDRQPVEDAERLARLREAEAAVSVAKVAAWTLLTVEVATGKPASELLNEAGTLYQRARSIDSSAEA